LEKQLSNLAFSQGQMKTPGCRPNSLKPGKLPDNFRLKIFPLAASAGAYQRQRQQRQQRQQRSPFLARSCWRRDLISRTVFFVLVMIVFPGLKVLNLMREHKASGMPILPNMQDVFANYLSARR